ncbi:MAG: hypothetical protein NTX86_00040, partial [Candidatus Dependentiae bacterium]|nr:hypothetical protein [Candidatus Dependentiae bacterium]
CEVTLSGMRIAENEVRDHFSVLLNILNESDDQVDFVLANNMRFYHIKRLTKTVDILLKYHLSPANTAMVCDFTQVPFKHERIQACVRKVKEMQNYKPIFFLWQHDFVSYRGINDVLFLQEFITLLLLIGRSSCHSNMKKMPTAKEVITLYNAIAALPIPELLNSLDAIVDQLTELLDGYELDAAMSWKSWLSKYWWVPPVVVASCIVNFFLQKGLPADNTVNLDF